MKQVIVLIVLVLAGCGKEESPAAKQPAKKPTLGEKLVGAYELDGDLIVFQKTGMMESYANGKKEGGKYKWKIVDKEVHAVSKDGGGRVWGMNPDGSLIYLAVIKSNGNKLYLPRLPKIGNTDYQPYWKKITDYKERIKETDLLKEGELKTERKNPDLDGDLETLSIDPVVEEEIRRQLNKHTGQLTEADLEKVTELSFSHNTRITDECLNDLVKLPKLRGLGLWDTQVTDAGIKVVAKLTQLERINLGGTKITNRGLKEVSKLTNLTYLNLRYISRITDPGLKELVKCKQLKNLYLGHTQITDTAEAELQKALPKCKIEE